MNGNGHLPLVNGHGETSDSSKIVSDAIFGFVSLQPYIVSIIDTLEFQRLRSIWQLGVTSFMYPTADHSRFEHSIGTYHLASILVRKLKTQLEKENKRILISDQEVKCVEIAALCHDIGQGPFSRIWDKLVLPNVVGKERLRPHEQFSNIWTVLKRNDKIKQMLADESLEMEHEKLIVSLVQGEKTAGKEILSEIINNLESGMDVAKWDYLARDSTYLGHASTNYRADIERMIHYARAILDENGRWKIAFLETERLNIIRVFELRHYVRQTACRHGTVIAIEQMMLDGFKRFFAMPENVHLKEVIGTAEWILENNDSIFWSNIKQITEFQRILKRELYRQIFEVTTFKIQDDPTAKIVHYLATTNGLQIDNIRFGYCKFSLGSTGEDPISKVPFYRKDNVRKILQRDTGNCSPKRAVDESKFMVFSICSNGAADDNEEEIIQYLQEYFEMEWTM